MVTRWKKLVPNLDTLVIAIGGGGLISGMAIVAKALHPEMEVVGVQTVRFPAMFNAVKGEHHPQGSSTIAEGIAVGTPGRIPMEIIRQRVDDLVLVDEGDIEQALVMLLEVRRWPGSAFEIPRAFQGQTGGSGLVWRQYRPLVVGGHH